MMAVEICAYSARDAALAVAAGADRIELCRAPESDGLTPSRATLKAASELLLHLPVHPIIRPRDDFTITADDFSQMTAAITAARSLGYPGVVFGGLTYGSTIEPDWVAVAELMRVSSGLSVTFHRAFDLVTDQPAALVRLAELGVQRILTSGAPGAAVDHLDRLADLVVLGSRHSVTIMAGGGVTSGNVDTLLAVGITELHASAGGSHGAFDIAEVGRLIRITRAGVDQPEPE